MLTFGAMQGALEALFEELAPEKIDKSVEPDGASARWWGPVRRSCGTSMPSAGGPRPSGRTGG